MDKYAFHYYIERLISNKDFAKIFSDKHIDVAEIFYKKYINSVNESNNITGSLASLITIKDHIISESAKSKAIYKEYLIKHIQKKVFTNNQRENEKLISVLNELIELEEFTNEIISAEEYLRDEKKVNIKVPKLFVTFFDLIESLVVGSQVYRLIDTSIIEQYNELVKIDLFYLARRYNRYIYNRLNIFVIEYILENQFNSIDPKLPSTGFKRRFIDIDMNLQRVEKPSLGRKGLDELAQERIDAHLSTFKNSDDFKRTKYWRSTDGPLDGSIILKEVVDYLIHEIPNSSLNEDQRKSITNKINTSTELEEYLPKTVRTAFYKQKRN